MKTRTSDAASEVALERAGPYRIERVPAMSLDALLQLLKAPATPLKVSSKAETLRAGSFVLKRDSSSAPLAALRRSLGQSRCGRAWRAARHLEMAGVDVPKPYAYVKQGRFGIIQESVMVSEYLEGCRDVEKYADENMAAWDVKEISAYLEGLAGAVNALCQSGACHGDLAGKNILTRDGRRFYFVDLDSIVLGRTYSSGMRMKNHVQLYDSFCDRWGDDVLGPFIGRMLPEGAGQAEWMRRVRERQAERRARTEAIWRREGKNRSNDG